MSIYKYKFDNILKYRKSVEINKKNQFSISLKKYKKEKNMLNNLNNKLNESHEDIKRNIKDGIIIDELLKMAEDQSYYKEGIRKKTIDVEVANNEVKKNRIELIKAMQDKKILERLKEIDFLNYKYEEERKTEKNLDEIIGFKHNSK